MLKSMTAYGRASIHSPIGRVVAEMQSVNRKFLEINVVLPKELIRFENDVKKILGAHIFRGQVLVKIFVYSDEKTPLFVSPNLALARQIKSAWDAIAQDLGVTAGQGFTLGMLAGDTGVLLYGEDLQDEELYRKAIQDALEEALKSFKEMRLHEGQALQEDIGKRLLNLHQKVNKINERAQGATDKYRQKLIERLEQVKPGITQDEERILREICIFADKIDVAEEITRFHSHLDQFDKYLKSDSEGIGKTLEFLLQELNREVNTMASKSMDVEISTLVVEIKTELERIREQIQNVE